MTSERGLWDTASERLQPIMLLKRVENKCDLGTPDVAWTCKLPRGKDRHNCIAYDRYSGWLELKEEFWPVRPETPLRIPSLTKDQVLWQEAWEEAGGRVATLIQADRDYLIVPPSVLRIIFERGARKNALLPYIIGSGKFPKVEIIKALTS